MLVCLANLAIACSWKIVNISIIVLFYLLRLPHRIEYNVHKNAITRQFLLENISFDEKKNFKKGNVS